MCFDIGIIRGHPVSDGTITLEARRAAFFHYHTVVNAPHMNGLLIFMVLCACLGLMVGLMRGSPEIRRRFVLIGAWSCIGTSGYLFIAIPKFLNIRIASQYHPELFDGWEKVFVARIALFISVAISLPLLFGLQKMAEAELATREVQGCDKSWIRAQGFTMGAQQKKNG